MYLDNYIDNLLTPAVAYTAKKAGKTVSTSLSLKGEGMLIKWKVRRKDILVISLLLTAKIEKYAFMRQDIIL